MEDYVIDGTIRVHCHLSRIISGDGESSHYTATWERVCYPHVREVYAKASAEGAAAATNAAKTELLKAYAGRIEEFEHYKHPKLRMGVLFPSQSNRRKYNG